MTQALILPQIAGLKLEVGEAGRLLVHFPYHPDTITRIKTIPGRRWHPDKKCWSVPYTLESLACLQSLFARPRPPLPITTLPVALPTQKPQHTLAEPTS